MLSTTRTFSDSATLPPLSQPWRGIWIWTPEPTPAKHAFVYFRREFDYQPGAGRALLYITAERDYTCWLNQRRIGHGPPISDPRFKRYDVYDVTDLLTPGRNCLAVRVYHDTTKGRMTAHAEAHGMLCQLQRGEETLIASDERWRARRSFAWMDPGDVAFGDSMWPEFFNANVDPANWQSAGFNDTDWPAAIAMIAPAHPLWGDRQNQSRFFPWVNLIASETAPAPLITHRPATVIAAGEVVQQRESSPPDTAVRMSLETILPFNKASVRDVENLISGSGAAMIRNSDLHESADTFNGIHNATIIFDFGRLMNARLNLRLTTPGSTTVDIGYAYRLENGRPVILASNRTAQADQYYSRPGEQSWQTADWRHFRYVQLTIRNLDGPMQLHEISAEEIGHRFEARGNVSASDPCAERAFDIMRRTALLNVVDRTMDNPSRERKQYLGDCSSILPALWSCFGDLALIRRYFAQAAEGQHATGLYRYSYPGHDNDGQSLFDHALSLPLRLFEHYQFFGDADLVAAMWPGVERLLQLAETCLDSNARMMLPPYNVWIDWAAMQREGHFLPLHAMTARVFECSAELARAAGRDGEHWRTLAAAMKNNISAWFDPERGVFVDSIRDGQRQSHVSEHANNLVLLWDMATPQQAAAVLAAWERQPDSFGQASPAWMYLPAAWAHAGRTDLAMRWIHKRLNQLAAQGLDTWPETWCLFGEQTLGHWRTRNSRAVAQGAGLGICTALLNEICGIQPAKPGFQEVRIAPQPGPLTCLNGTQPGPDGDYALQLKKSGGAWEVKIQMPAAKPVILDLPFAPGAAKIAINGQERTATDMHRSPSGALMPRWRISGSASFTIQIPATSPGGGPTA